MSDLFPIENPIAYQDPTDDSPPPLDDLLEIENPIPAQNPLEETPPIAVSTQDPIYNRINYLMERMAAKIIGYLGMGLCLGGTTATMIGAAITTSSNLTMNKIGCYIAAGGGLGTIVGCCCLSTGALVECATIRNRNRYHQ